MSGRPARTVWFASLTACDGAAAAADMSAQEDSLIALTSTPREGGSDSPITRVLSADPYVDSVTNRLLMPHIALYPSRLRASQEACLRLERFLRAANLPAPARITAALYRCLLAPDTRTETIDAEALNDHLDGVRHGTPPDRPQALRIREGGATRETPILLLCRTAVEVVTLDRMLALSRSRCGAWHVFDYSAANWLAD